MRYQINQEYGYFDDPELIEEAQGIVDSGDEREAWLFLLQRSAWEYEGVRKEEVLS